MVCSLLFFCQSVSLQVRRGKAPPVKFVFVFSLSGFTHFYASGNTSSACLSVCNVLTQKATLQHSEPVPQVIETGCKPVFIEFALRNLVGDTVNLNFCIVMHLIAICEQTSSFTLPNPAKWSKSVK